MRFDTRVNILAASSADGIYVEEFDTVTVTVLARSQ